MAKPKITPQNLNQLHLTEAEYPHWNAEFAEASRCNQIEDDLFAARSVSALLIAIVTFGALLGGFAVLVATLT